VVPGVMNNVAAFTTRFMPRRMQAAAANLFMTRN
jgi:hypothetical protein